ncbi:Putative major facilitator superfamily, MFS transporter superfamily [Septoria linicola]|uniref:Major facilitator superfamily, MFS transporter superfamily n=1 Tax=Septoria linicola TaxID=215465 RepID=A0A9Q9AY11_9PEZI|nr:Putative major facilitator superfamily, MFS transporter superfamily [Septoria linicola]
MDLHILPWICSAYLVNYLDRVNLGNARTLNNDMPEDNIVQQLGMSGNRYSIAVAVFFVPFPSNILLKYFTPRVWIGRIMISWGIVTLCTAAVSSYAGLLVVRFFLGLAEAGFFPGVIMYLCFWYPPHERATRMAIFAGSVAVAGAFSGLLASGIGFMNGVGGLRGWQWLFIWTGMPAVILGVAVWLWMPNYPQDCTFLDEEERAFAIARMGPFAPSADDKHFDKSVAKQTLMEPLFWIFALQYSFMTNSLNAFGYFAPTIVASLGFEGHTAQLLTVPPNVFALIIIIGNCLHSDFTKERTKHVIGGGIIAIANCGGISAPFLFPSIDGPQYEKGNWTVFAFLATSVFITTYQGWRLGTGFEYRDVKQTAGQNEQETQRKLSESNETVKTVLKEV